MIRIAKGDRAYCERFIQSLKDRVRENDRSVEDGVAAILRDVRDNGDRAVRAYSEKFDGWVPDSLEISMAEIERITADCDPAFLAAMERAAENIRAFHARQKQQSRIDPERNGVLMGQRVRGLHRVGVYVPGGTAAYPSSVLMNVIPAKIAEVGEIVMVTPPGRTGKPDKNILAAAKIAGVDRVFLIGGAQAVAALAYGTESVPKVDKVVGPGNIFVATAKKLLYGTIDIDMIAGPSEILVIADSSAKPEYLAADLMSQAEHDRMASAILITPDEALARATANEIERQMETLSRRDIIRESIDNFGAIIVCESLTEAVDFANELAPEHLEVCCENPLEYIGKLDNAGSVFLGNYSPEPLGDYFAGPNHVLPTSGTARFFSPLSVDDFIKKSSFIYYTKDALLAAADDIIRIAETEELTAHANSIAVRRDTP
jgi:histidinol dehydrogenase